MRDRIHLATLLPFKNYYTNIIFWYIALKIDSLFSPLTNTKIMNMRRRTVHVFQKLLYMYHPKFKCIFKTPIMYTYINFKSLRKSSEIFVFLFKIRHVNEYINKIQLNPQAMHIIEITQSSPRDSRMEIIRLYARVVCSPTPESLDKWCIMW